MMAFQGKLLKRAIEICGGWNAFCARLHVTDHSLKFWIDGKARMPDAIFLRVTDIVLEDDIARAKEDRRRSPRATAVPVQEQDAART